MSEAQYLNAFVGRGKSFQVITEEYSRDAVRELMSHAPEAITLAPAGTVDATRLLARLKSLTLTLERHRNSRNPHRWKCYWQGRRKDSLQFCGILDDERHIPIKFEEFSQQLDQSDRGMVLFVCLESGLDEDLAASVLQDSANEYRTIQFIKAAASARDDEQDTDAVTSKESASDRLLLREARKDLLSKVPSFTSEELATAGGSISDNASQYAFDLRSRGKVFGVRLGRTWHYPKFQFDAQRRVVADMKAVLEALSPDPHGWDRLQWFVTPHENLMGHSPLEIWDSDRNKVIEAAKTEQWHGRRD